ncbi:MAG: DUF3153 domain-containing protein [Oscillatoriales cyanobacterium C42_A2020_001]|nr:DUF3153 domain-containing protein [Leptolyngbyaceae cyanobacterium C42_A2020_001]
MTVQFRILVAAWMRSLTYVAHRMRMLVFVGVLATVLMGCVESDVNLRFENPNQGEIVQHIQLGDRLQALSGGSLQPWVKTIERQAASLGGRVQRTNQAGLTVKIPFTSSDELEQKFNQFFEAVFNQEQIFEGASLPAIASRLTVTHSNFLLLERNRLRVEVDLRSLGVTSTTGTLLVSPASLIKLEFKLETPWGARNVSGTNLLPSRNGKQLVWRLIPGEPNTLESVFWMPSPLGIGIALIIGLVLLGQFLKNARSPRSPQQPSLT